MPDQIVVDSSVFVAVIREEETSRALVIALRSASQRLMSAGNYLECALVAECRLGGLVQLDAWIGRERIAVIPVDLDSARLAADAFRRFGKCRHPAKLNYGDCFAYALARMRALPLLYKGDDFALTDITPALP